MAVVMDLLAGVRAEQGKVVIVSNYVETLNILQALCERRRWQVLRLDGSTPGDKRQELVDRFNSAYNTTQCIFLLSAKAGGQGLNLIGGNRLVLFDPEWNPAIDLQAMARIWRDGQPLPCFIYRLIATGTIDEKILQRQMRKQEVAGTVMRDRGAKKSGGGGGGGGGERMWDSRTLKELFKFRGVSDCETFDALMAKGKGDGGKEGKPATPSKGKEVVVSGKRWNCAWRSEDSDDVLVRKLSNDVLSCVWSRTGSSEDMEEVESILQQLTEESEETAQAESEAVGTRTSEPPLHPSTQRPSDPDNEAGEAVSEEGDEGEEDEAVAADDEELATSAESTDALAQSDDPLADWRLDRIEAERARRAEQKARKKAQALKLAQEDVALLLGEDEEEVHPPPAKSRSRAMVEADSDEDEFMKGEMPAASPASPRAGRVRVKRESEVEEEEMLAIQSLLDQPSMTNVSAARALGDARLIHEQ